MTAPFSQSSIEYLAGRDAFNQGVPWCQYEGPRRDAWKCGWIDAYKATYTAARKGGVGASAVDMQLLYSFCCLMYRYNPN